MTPKSKIEPSEAPSRREGLIVLALAVLAAVVRLSGFGRLGLTHFDEGIYATAGLWATSPRGIAAFGPQVIAYAPAGFPWLIGMAYQFLGVSDASAILVAIVCGVATIPVAAWVARRTFGEGAGASAATFAALSVAHLAFSRKALTDAPFLLSWLVALGLGGRLLEKPGLRAALSLGLAVGLAQNLKYHGYLAGVIVAICGLLGLLVDRPARRPAAIVRTFGFGTCAALIAAATYWPWFRFVEGHGGYADLLRHQKSYLGGLDSWYEHWKIQLAQVVALSGGGGWVGLTWLTSCVVCVFTCRRRPRAFWADPGRGTQVLLPVVLGGAALALIPELSWWVGLAWVPWLLADPRPAPRLLGVWWLVLSVLTPFYHPYARLWLPLHAAGWLLLAGVVVRVATPSETLADVIDRRTWARNQRPARAAAALTCLLLARFHWGGELPRPLPWNWGGELPRPLPWTLFYTATDDLRAAVTDLNLSSPSQDDQGSTVRVLARRPVAYYLLLKRSIPFRLLRNQGDFLAGPGGTDDWCLVDEVQLDQGRFDRSSRHLKAGWTPVKTWEVVLDPVTLLDVNPHAAFELFPAVKRSLVLFAPNSNAPDPQNTRPIIPRSVAPPGGQFR